MGPARGFYSLGYRKASFMQIPEMLTMMIKAACVARCIACRGKGSKRRGVYKCEHSRPRLQFVLPFAMDGCHPWDSDGQYLPRTRSGTAI